MKKTYIQKGGVLVLLIVSSISFSGCKIVDYFTKQSGSEYRSAITDELNALTPAVEQTLTAYDESVPDLVSENSSIDTAKLADAALGLENALPNLDTALAEESYDSDLQKTIYEKLTAEKTALLSYQEAYTEMMTYYTDGTYKTALADVEIYDTKIQDRYNTVVDAHNATVDGLEIK